MDDRFERHLSIGPLGLPGVLRVPMRPRGVVVFAQAGGGGRLSRPDIHVAETLGRHRLATLLFDLLSPDEARQHANVLDVPLLAGRLLQAVERAAAAPDLRRLPVGLFGADTGAAAALAAAAALGAQVACVVSRGGRPDLAGQVLARVTAPTLLIVGSLDLAVLELNRAALKVLGGDSTLAVVPGAGHLFEEAGSLDLAAARAAGWFVRFMPEERANQDRPAAG